MERKDQLQAAYAEYLKQEQVAEARSVRFFLWFLIYTVSPLTLMMVFLLLQPTTQLQNIGSLFGVGLLVVFAGGYYFSRRRKHVFKGAKEWENFLGGYLKEAGVNPATLNPVYVHSKSYAGDEGYQPVWESRPAGDARFYNPNVIYAGEAEVNGSVVPIEIRTEKGIVGVYAEEGELIPAS